MDKTSLGDRMKWYEKRYESKVMPMFPILCRIDGCSFSRFTKGLERPYDGRLSNLMVAVTKFLVDKTNARCGYTQSDEISLVWLTKDPKSEIFFGGKLTKMISVVGSLATACFNKMLLDFLPEKADQMPVFDNRVWEVPTYSEATNYFVWREQDATRNSISIATRYYYSHSECYGKNSSDLQEMLRQKNVNWNEYPTFFKRGTYIRKQFLERKLTTEELQELPPKHNAHQNPDMIVKRSTTQAEDFPPLTQITNREEVILFGALPF